MIRLTGTLRLLAAMLTCVLASCGGGGGGGGDGGNPPTVTASAGSFEVVGIVPSASVSNTVVFTLTGGSKDGYYAEASSNLSGLQAQLVINADSTASVSLLDTTSSTATGLRTGSITFKLCSDRACNYIAWTHAYPVTVGRFQLDTSPLTLVGHEGGDTPVTLTVTPGDTTHILAVQSAYAGTATPWLSATHDGAGNLLVTASAANLAAGSYPSTLSIGPDLAPFSAMIPVTFNVGLGMTVPALADIVERVDTAAGTLQGSGAIAFAGAGHAWTATSNAAWLVVDTPAGTGAGTLAYHVDPAAADAAVANWSAGVATITLKSTGLSDATATLTYRRQLPEIAMISPSQIWPGRATTVRVTGRGLSQLTQVGQILVGTQAAAGTLDSDTHATLQVPALAAGSLQVRIANALQVTGTQANLAVAAGRLPYAALATAGAKNNIVYDPSRQAVFASDDDANTLLRWQASGGAWTVTALPWSGIWRVQLAPDRQTLYVLAKGSLSEVDPDTLTVRTTHNGWNWSGFDFDEALPITSDLRMWLPESGTQYFDLRTHAFAFASDTSFPGVGLTTMAATPDGAYMYSVDGSSSPAPPDGWYSAATQTNAPLPSGVLERAYRVNFALDGSLGLFDWESVYHTGSWMLAGTATLPGSESGWGGVISPDGTRVYRLAGPHTTDYAAIDHVDVFDTTQLQPGTSQFVLLGTIAVADRATNCTEPECDIIGRLVIDQLGSNLFWVGNKNFVVIPIPQSMSGTASTRSHAARLQPSAAMAASRR